MLEKVRLVLLTSAAVVGCATPPRPPPLQQTTLGMARADFRDYSSSPGKICEAEPRWLFDEVASVNGLLARFLDSTGGGYDGDWTDDQLDLLEKGSRTLPPVLDTHHQNLEALARCGFAAQRGFPALRKRGLELITGARHRIAEGPKLAAYARARDALERYWAERPQKQFTARQNLCPNLPRVGRPDLFFAYENEKGQVEWLFCDSAKVIKDGKRKPEFHPPVGLSRREARRVRSSNYLRAVSRFPASEIQRPPKLPFKGSKAEGQTVPAKANDAG